MFKGYYRALKMGGKRTQYGGNIYRNKPMYDDALRYALSIPGRIRAGLFEPVASLKSKGHADRDIGRSQAALSEGNRYENMEPLQPDPAPSPNTSGSASTSKAAAKAEVAAPIDDAPSASDTPAVESQGSLFDIGGDDA